jgi:hypothetical protein
VNAAEMLTEDHSINLVHPLEEMSLGVQIFRSKDKMWNSESYPSVAGFMISSNLYKSKAVAVTGRVGP